MGYGNFGMWFVCWAYLQLVMVVVIIEFKGQIDLTHGTTTATI